MIAIAGLELCRLKAEAAVGPEQRCSWNVLGYISLAVRPEGVQPDVSVPICGKVRIIHSTFWISVIAFRSLRLAAPPPKMASIPVFLG